MSFTIDHSYQLMGTAELTKLREQAMLALARGGSIPEPVRLYILTLEARYLDAEARRRSASCRDMWDQFAASATADSPGSGQGPREATPDAELGPGRDPKTTA